MNQCKAIHYKKNKQYKKKKYYRDNVPNKQTEKKKKIQLSFRTPICHYNGIVFLMAWSNKNNYNNKNNA